MPLPVLSDRDVTLRPPLPEDIQDRLRVGRVPEYILMCGGEPDDSTAYAEADAIAWYERALSEPYGWCIEVGKRCIGHARLHSVDEADRRARYAIGIFDPSAWGHRYGTRATKLVLRYAFEELSLHHVDLRVLAYSRRAIACYTATGFRREGIEREAAYIGGRGHDDVIMSILEQEYRAQNGTARERAETATEGAQRDSCMRGVV